MLNIIEYKEELKRKFSNVISIENAHLQMSTNKELLKIDSENISKYKLAAVQLIIYIKDSIPTLILIQRNEYEGIHSGQFAFPGGKSEKTDSSILQTSIRETFEEIGVKITEKNFIAELAIVNIPVSNFIVYPFVSILESIPEYVLDTKEVKQVLEVSLKDILDDNNIGKTSFTYKQNEYNTNCFNFDGNIVWGATAMILNEFKHSLLTK